MDEQHVFENTVSESKDSIWQNQGNNNKLGNLWRNGNIAVWKQCSSKDGWQQSTDTEKSGRNVQPLSESEHRKEGGPLGFE